MKCGKCNATMKEKRDTLFGENVKIYVCVRCGNKLIPLKEAIKVQQKNTKIDYSQIFLRFYTWK